MNLIKRHKGLALVGGLTLILIIIMFIICAKMIFTSGNSVYGQRLNGLVDIDKDVTDGIVEEISAMEEVSDIEIRIQGKIIYTTITFKEGTTLNRAKEIAAGTVSKYDEEVLGYYDLGYFLKEEVAQVETENEEIEEKKGFTVAGTKHPDVDSISWTKS